MRLLTNSKIIFLYCRTNFQTQKELGRIPDGTWGVNARLRGGGKLSHGGGIFERRNKACYIPPLRRGPPLARQGKP
jgi:hypothetical protein